MQYVHLNDWHNLYKTIIDFGLDAEPSLQPAIEKCRSIMPESPMQHHTTPSRYLTKFPDEILWCNLTMLFDLCITGTALEDRPELQAAKNQLASLTHQRECYYARAGETPPDMVSSFVRQFL